MNRSCPVLDVPEVPISNIRKVVGSNPSLQNQADNLEISTRVQFVKSDNETPGSKESSIQESKTLDSLQVLSPV